MKNNNDIVKNKKFYLTTMYTSIHTRNMGWHV